MICRAGGLTKADIGTIRVFDHETKFEISAEAADKFTADIKKRVGETPRIEPMAPAAKARPAPKAGGKPDKRTRSGAQGAARRLSAETKCPCRARVRPHVNGIGVSWRRRAWSTASIAFEQFLAWVWRLAGAGTVPLLTRF